MFFHFSEVLEEVPLHISDEVEFTVVPVSQKHSIVNYLDIMSVFWTSSVFCKCSLKWFHTPGSPSTYAGIIIHMVDLFNWLSCVQDMLSAQRNHAVRIKKLPKGTVSFHTQSEQRFIGVIDKDVPSAAKNASPTKNKDPKVRKPKAQHKLSFAFSTQSFHHLFWFSSNFLFFLFQSPFLICLSLEKRQGRICSLHERTKR